MLIYIKILLLLMISTVSIIFPQNNFLLINVKLPLTHFLCRFFILHFPVKNLLAIQSHSVHMFHYLTVSMQQTGTPAPTKTVLMLQPHQWQSVRLHISHNRVLKTHRSSDVKYERKVPCQQESAMFGGLGLISFLIRQVHEALFRNC